MRGDELSASHHGGGLHESKIPVFTASGITRLALAFTSVYIALTSLAVCLAEVKTLRFFNLYYLFLMGVCAFCALTSLRELSFRRPGSFGHLRWLRTLVLLGLGLAAWGIYRYPNLFSFSLWLDEVTQFQGDWNLPRQVVDPALFAAMQQQPPVDYYLSAVARIVLGSTEFAALVHAVVFGVLSFLAFLVWLVQIRFPLALAPVPILLFASHHTLLRFSSEARPISLAVFFTLTTMILVFESVQRKKACTLALGVSSLLLLYSVGLQPIFFLLALTAGLLPLLLRHLERTEMAKLVLALSVVPLILFLPTLWEIYRESDRQNQFFTASYFELWWQALRGLNWESFRNFFVTFQFATWVLWVPLIALVAALLLRGARIKLLPSGAASWALAGVIFSFLFPIAFQIFWIIVDWTQNKYYFVLWPVGLFALGSLSVTLFLRPILVGKRRVWMGAILALVCSGAVYQLHHTYVPTHRERVSYDHNLRPNWHVVVEKARQAKRPVVVVEIPYGTLGWPPHFGVAGRFYEDPPRLNVVQLDKWRENNFGVVTFRIQESMVAVNQHSDMFYLMSLYKTPQNQAEEKIRQKLLSMLRENTDEVIQLGKKILLLRVNDQASPIESTRSLFRKIVEVDPGSDQNFYLADALASASIYEASCGEANKWFGIMELVDREPGRGLAGSNEGLQKYLAKIKNRIERLPACEGMRLVRAGSKPHQSSPGVNAPAAETIE